MKYGAPASLAMLVIVGLTFRFQVFTTGRWDVKNFVSADARNGAGLEPRLTFLINFDRSLPISCGCGQPLFTCSPDSYSSEHPATLQRLSIYSQERPR